ncbi:MAG: PD-(D/E)XK nuclease family protein [Clostridia bacterium]|nr:PD-(D/E)XK nuclease family protein [Clostridia bacterium]
MALQMIVGSAGCGKTSYAMDIFASSGSAAKRIYIVPESSSYVAETLVAGKFGASSSASVSVLSFKRLYTELANLYGRGGYTKLGKSGRAMILSSICQNLKGEFKILEKPARHKGFASLVSDTVGEFKIHGITPDMLKNLSASTGDDALCLKLHDLFLIYSEYERIMENQFEDADDETGILAGLIAENPDYFADSCIIFDGFSFFSPNQMNVINELISQARDVYFTFTCNNTEPADEDDLFYMQKKTAGRIKALAQKAGIRINEDIVLAECKKFDKFPEMQHFVSCCDKETDVPCPSSGNLSISVFNDIEDEITYVARQIESLVRSGRYRYKDIAVIARNKEAYSIAIERVFSKFEIPVFISGNQNALALPAVTAVMSALNIIIRNFSYESVFDYLKSGFASDDPDKIDLLENYITATGIRGKLWTNGEDWKYTPTFAGAYESSEEFLALVNSVKNEVITPVIDLKNTISDAKTIKEYCRAMYAFMNEIHLRETIDGLVERFKYSDIQEASYYAQVWNTLVDVLDELANILGDTNTDITGFYDLLTTGFSAHDIGVIPTAIDVIRVLSDKPEGTAKIAFAIGVNDGVYPSAYSDGGLINDSDKRVFEENDMPLSDTSYLKTFEENYTIYNILTFPSEALEITYPISDALGGSLLPARLISRFEKMFGIKANNYILTDDVASADMISSPGPTSDLYVRNVSSKLPYDAKWDEAGKWFAENPDWNEKLNLFEAASRFKPKTATLNADVLSSVYKNDFISLGVSRMERFSKCPFSYYLNYILRLKERENSMLQNTDTGSIMHDVIEKLSVNINSAGYNWSSAPEDFILTETERIVNEKISEVSEMFGYSSNRRTWLLIRLKSTLITSVLFIAKHLRAGAFVPLGYEIEFANGSKYTPLKIDIGGKTVSLKGKIDRADMYVDENGNRFVRVIDYKSGSRSFDVSNMYYGLELQLMVYLDRLCDLENASPAGILYFRFNDPVLEQDKGSIEDEFRMKGLVLKDEGVIRAMDNTFTDKSSVIPVSYLKSGDYSKHSSVASAAQFAGMRKRLHTIIRQIGKELAGGKTDIAPVKTPSVNGCEYCSFKQACLFDPLCGGKYKNIDFLPKEDIIKELEKMGGENDA